jgi:tight adherence protein C
MSPIAIYVYALIGVTALSVGTLVFFLFPGRKEVVDHDDEVRQALAGRQQRSFAASLVAAVPAGYTGWLEKQYVLAGRPEGWAPSRTITTKILLGAIGVVLGALFAFGTGFGAWKLLLGIAFALILFFLPDALVNSRAHDRQQAIQKALPDTLDQMTIAVEAGLGFDAAMAKAARGGSGPLAEELIRVLQDMSIGRTRRDAFLELEHRTNVPDLRRFVRAVMQADGYGIAIGDVLRVQAGEMRMKRRQRAEEQAQKVTVKILFPLIFCLLPALLIVVLTPAVLGIISAFSSGL